MSMGSMPIAWAWALALWICFVKMGAGEENVLLPVELGDGAFAYMNPNGDLVGDAIFEFCSFYSNGVAAVRREDLWYIVDGEFEEMAGPFERVIDLKGRPGLVKRKSGAYAYVLERTFDLIGSYDDATPFVGGKATVRDGKSWIIIDDALRRIGNQYDFLSRFTHGLASYRRGLDWGLVDGSGSEHPIDATSISDVAVLSAELYAVRQNGDDFHVIYAMNPDGDDRIIYEAVIGFHAMSEGVIWLCCPDDDWVALDESGVKVGSLNARSVLPFTEGLCAFKSEGNWGYLSLDWDVVIPPTFDLAGQFYHGHATVRMAGIRRRLLIDRMGKVVDPFGVDEGKSSSPQ